MDALLEILIKEEGTITIENVSQIVGECFAEKNRAIRSNYHTYIRLALERELIDPDQLLSVSLAESRETIDLILPSLALRRGGNPNLYLQTPGIGPVHLTVYTLNRLREASRTYNFIHTALCLLVLLGSRTNSLAFDTNGGGPAPSFSSFDTVLVQKLVPKRREEDKQISAQDWIRAQGHPDYTTSESFLSGATIDFKILLGVLADEPSLVFSNTYAAIVVPRIEQLSLAHSLKVVDAMTIITTSPSFQEDHGQIQIISQAISFGVSDIFKILVDKGLFVSYFTVNDIILNLIEAAKTENKILFSEYTQMLLHIVARGTVIDTEQMLLININSELVGSAVATEYNKPLWEKVCSGALSAPLSSSLKSLAVALNLDTTKSKDDICSEIRSHTEVSADILKRAAINRHRRHAGLLTGTLREFIDGTPERTCINRTARQTDPFSYNDAQLAFYSNKKDELWCFTSDTYEQLLEKKINPTNGEKLPAGFLRQIRTQLEQLEMLGLSPADPLSTILAIDSLSTPDAITDKESSFYVETIIKLGLATGVEESFILSLSPDRMNAALSMINMEQNGLEKLSQTHRLITFARAVYSAVKQDTTKTKRFFGSLLLNRSEIVK
jgi:hypothetical protein